MMLNQVFACIAAAAFNFILLHSCCLVAFSGLPPHHVNICMMLLLYVMSNLINHGNSFFSKPYLLPYVLFLKSCSLFPQGYFIAALEARWSKENPIKSVCCLDK